MKKIRFAFAGDRDISIWVLEYLLSQKAVPVALMVSDEAKATHAEALKSLCPFLDNNHIFPGDAFRNSENINTLKQLNLDYIIGIHFPYIIPREILTIPKQGVINLHPAFLPFNRGWHTPSWAILDESPYGATLHFMDEEVDTGDIIHQHTFEVSDGDTADSIYQKVKLLELQVFKEAWPYLVNETFTRIPQNPSKGTSHKRTDLASQSTIHLDQTVKTGDLIRKLRALTTNNIKESVYYDVGNKRYRIQVRITEDPQ